MRDGIQLDHNEIINTTSLQSMQIHLGSVQVKKEPKDLLLNDSVHCTSRSPTSNAKQYYSLDLSNISNFPTSKV